MRSVAMLGPARVLPEPGTPSGSRSSSASWPWPVQSPGRSRLPCVPDSPHRLLSADRLNTMAAYSARQPPRSSVSACKRPPAEPAPDAVVMSSVYVSVDDSTKDPASRALEPQRHRRATAGSGGQVRVPLSEPRWERSAGNATSSGSTSGPAQSTHCRSRWPHGGSHPPCIDNEEHSPDQ